MSIPRMDESVDVSICYNMLMHLPDFKAPLKELFRVTKKHMFVRAMFGEATRFTSHIAPPDYEEVYPDGMYPFNTWNRYDVAKFVDSLGDCRIWFREDNVKSPEETLKKQEEVLDIRPDEFAREKWKHLDLNYEVMVVEKV